MKHVLAVVACCGLTLAVSPAVAATPVIRGAVGPDDTIRLVTKPKKAGTFTVIVQDRSDEHNFRLRGPGVNAATSVGGTGTKTFRVVLRRGTTYTFLCDPHADEMRGSFTVPR